MLQNTPNCIYRGNMPPNPLSKHLATPRVESIPPNPPSNCSQHRCSRHAASRHVYLKSNKFYSWVPPLPLRNPAYAPAVAAHTHSYMGSIIISITFMYN